MTSEPVDLALAIALARAHAQHPDADARLLIKLAHAKPDAYSADQIRALVDVGQRALEHRRHGETVDDDSLCVCAHRRSSHASPASADTRCLVVEDRQDLLGVFDDGREHELGYCACRRYRPR